MSRTDLTNNATYHDDEIDLFELIATLWRHKWLIIGITVLATLIAGAVAFLVMKPSYQSQATITAPNPYQIAPLNNGIVLLQADQKVSTINPDQVYNTLIQTLGATDLQRQFFRSSYLPRYQDDPKVEDTQKGFEKFQKSLSIQKAADNNNRTLAFNNENPQVAYELLNEFLQFADAEAKRLLLENRKAEIDTMVSNIENTLRGMQIEMDAQTDFELSELKNAYETAGDLEITAPMEKPTELYQQGTHALASKIKFLEAQRGNYNRNSRYNTLSMMLDSYRAIQLPSAEKFSTFKFNALPEVPETPTKPNKKLIVIIGFLLGGMLGVVIVLLREAIRNYRARKAAEA
ncbi:LPS O-antigen chain length determinant protein WzzB [Ignatzschineria cameli]|uniref:LPS O-antigen chain length determinant protein WzzB n=1 Tax=Ignatzschineria cameli TaxID=2182793 RepID=UPI000D608345|nr:Wzz/FepE/Etk N-terminal domain-containing protein [Ignatzschineria cameli]PWD85369.1 hypothetical protein DC080_06845 [Ignatzschineria cameli]